jgi:hypothetical protein
MKKTIVLLCVFLFTNISFSQYGKYPKPQKPDKVFRQMEKQRMKEMKAKNKDRIKSLVYELEDYTHNKIMPQMIIWKTKIDTSISPNDKIYLDSLRQIANLVNDDSKNLKKDKSKALKSGNDEAINEDAKRMKELKKEEKEINNNLKDLMADYKNLFDPLKSEIRQKIDSWEKEASDIAVKWIDSHKYNLTDKEKKRVENLWKYSKILNINKIVLWDGQKITNKNR